MEIQSQNYLDKYLNSLIPSKRKEYTSFSCDYFCADEYNADLCADLIYNGYKTATCSLKYSYEVMNEDIPKPSHLQVVTNYKFLPICIIEVKSVKECKYSDVSESFFLKSVKI